MLCFLAALLEIIDQRQSAIHVAAENQNSCLVDLAPRAHVEFGLDS